MSAWCTVAFLSVALSVSAGGVANLTGAWRLNVEKSHWGTRPKPASVILQIQHNEPALAYTGEVIYSGEDIRPFSFTGAVDGHGYSMDRSFGTGIAILQRTSPTAFETVFRTNDGSGIETTLTTISLDGRTLTRRIRLRIAGVTSTSTEVYERQ